VEVEEVIFLVMILWKKSLEVILIAFQGARTGKFVSQWVK
jgi:hypothetical protein